MTDTSSLAYLDEKFEDAPEPEIGTSLPNGKYQFRVDSVEVTETKSEPAIPMFKQELVVVDGEYAGKTVWRNNLLDVPDDGGLTGEAYEAKRRQRLGFFKKDLKAYGIDIAAPDFRLSSFLETRLGELLDRVVEGAVQNKKDSSGTERSNIYLNSWVGMWSEEAGLIPNKGTASSVATTAQPKGDPFADE